MPEINLPTYGQVESIKQSVKTEKIIEFLTPGQHSWTAPKNVTSIFITACGGGGSGGITTAIGSSGGITTFSDLLSLSGGGGGGGASGYGGSGVGAGQSGGQLNSSAVISVPKGGDSLGYGGISSRNYNGDAQDGSLGGGGGGGFDSNNACGGGADYCIDKPIQVTPGVSYTIIIATGGIRKSSLLGSGGNGYMKIRYWE